MRHRLCWWVPKAEADSSQKRRELSDKEAILGCARIVRIVLGQEAIDCLQ